MRAVGITWKDAEGRHRGFTITAGSANVGHLVELILAACGTQIRIDEVQR